MKKREKPKTPAAGPLGPDGRPIGPPGREEQEPTPESVVEDLVVDVVGDMIEFEIFSLPDRLDIKLHCEEEPLATNGKWDPEAKAVVWSAEARERRLLPLFTYALWCRPDRTAQEKHFGSVVLEGEDLAEYAMWYCGLTKAETQEWDRFVAGLKGDGDWKRALEEFRFTSDPKPDPNDPEAQESLADEPRSLILKEEWRQKMMEKQPKPPAPGKGPVAPPPPPPAPAPVPRAPARPTVPPEAARSSFLQNV